MLTRPSFPHLAGLFLLIVSPCFAQETPPDSGAATYSAAEVVVTGTRIPQAFTRTPGLVSTLTDADLRSMPGSLLADALGVIPGAAFRSYGAGASVQTLSLRGLPPEHTLVLVDGQRTSSVQNGLLDFGLISSTNIERVEIAQGGLSALYGADAIGGAVNIITRKAPKSFTLSAATTIGSAHFSGLELQAGVPLGTAAARVSVRREQGRADYPFLFNDGAGSSELRRTGEDFRTLTADGRIDWQLASSLSMYATGSYIDADRGSPGPFTDRLSAGGARLYDRQRSIRAGGVLTMSADVQVRLDGSGSTSQETYADPRLLHGQPTRSVTTNHAYIVTPAVRWSGIQGLIVDGGVEFAQAAVEGNELAPASRSQRSVFAAVELTAIQDGGLIQELLVVPAVRYDSYSDVAGDVSPRLGVSVGVIDRQILRLRSSIAKSYHVPTFNDMYWIAGGNPELHPERSVSVDAGAHSRLAIFGAVDLDLSLFDVTTHDRIVWIPGSSGLWSPRNYASVTSRGVEGSLVWSLPGDLLRLEANTTLLSTTKESADYPGDPTRGKELLYTPRQTTNALASLTWNGFALTVRYSWSSYRYTTEINDRFLPSYGVASGALSYATMSGAAMIRGKLELTNLFDESYQVIALYPMPLRQMRGTVEVTL